MNTFNNFNTNSKLSIAYDQEKILECSETVTEVVTYTTLDTLRKITSEAMRRFTTPPSTIIL